MWSQVSVCILLYDNKQQASVDNECTTNAKIDI